MRLDSARLQALRRLLILDSQPEQAYDDITRLLAGTLGVPITMVNLLDADRDWFKSRVGMPLQESPAASSFCEAFFDCAEDVIVVEDTLCDPRFAQHPLVVGAPHIRFYAAARLEIEGQTVGTLCAYDMQPRQLSAEHRAELQTLTRAAAQLLSQRASQDRAESSESP